MQMSEFYEKEAFLIRLALNEGDWFDEFNKFSRFSWIFKFSWFSWNWGMTSKLRHLRTSRILIMRVWMIESLSNCIVMWLHLCYNTVEYLEILKFWDFHDFSWLFMTFHNFLTFQIILCTIPVESYAYSRDGVVWNVFV